MISKGIKKGEVVYVSKKDDLLVVEMKKRKVVSPIKRATSIAFSNA
jgi:hypothetical protein